MSYYTNYKDALIGQIANASNCLQLQNIYNAAIASFNGLITSVNDDLTAVQTAATNLQNSITALNDQAATLAASQSGVQALTTLPGLAAGMITTAQVIAFCQAQANLLSTQGSTQVTTFVKQAVALAKQVAQITHDFNVLQTQITNLLAQVAELPIVVAAITASATAKALSFPSCIV